MRPPGLPASARPIVLVFAGLALMAVGCGGGRGTPPDVAAGRYTARISGGLVDTLTGSARYRMDAGQLVALELGERGAPGLSIELDPRPPALRTYSVLAPALFRQEGRTRTDTTEHPASALTFMEVGPARLHATGGALEVAYIGEERVAGTFTLRMQGGFRNSPDDDLTVRVTGRLHALPLRE